MRSLPYFCLRRLRACRIRRRVAFRRPLKQAISVCWREVPCGMVTSKVRRPRVSRSFWGGIITRGDSVVFTPDMRGGLGCLWDGSLCVHSRGLVSCRMSRRLAFARRRILEISWRTALCQMWRGRGALVGDRCCLWGNIAVTTSIAVPSMA
jgi:hypothetical protein